MSMVVILAVVFLLAALIWIAFVYKADASFWESMYRSLNRTYEKMYEQNKRLIESCEHDLEFAQEVLDDNKQLIAIMKAYRLEQDKYELRLVEEENEAD